MKRSIWIGFDPREAAAFAVARSSAENSLNIPIPVRGLVLSELQRRHLFWRHQELRAGRIWDTISGAHCATEFSISRFLVPTIASSGWALFMDCDVLVRGNLGRLFEIADRNKDKAVLCVKHKHEPPEGLKMDGQIQTAYARKNWSSVMLFNCDHKANKPLTPELVNSVPGRDLHAFCWLEDDSLIGELGQQWNWLAGHSSAAIDPEIVHHTDGSPCLPGYENAPYAAEWRAELARWAA